ncbi:MAG TPA: endonuclease domain-containing protein [Rhodocyclaceae bacterium]|nr:endonuclease domain-containing protein [Rhodocyclaceae bacterium]
MSERIARDTKVRSRELRSTMTLAEKKLWAALRNRQLAGQRFRRQHPVGTYIADFACVEAGLIVEADGGQHADEVSYDERRTAFMEQHSFRVLRFWNNEIMENLEGVLLRIVEALKQKTGR